MELQECVTQSTDTRDFVDRGNKKVLFSQLRVLNILCIGASVRVHEEGEVMAEEERREGVLLISV